MNNKKKRAKRQVKNIYNVISNPYIAKCLTALIIVILCMIFMPVPMWTLIILGAFDAIKKE